MEALSKYADDDEDEEEPNLNQTQPQTSKQPQPVLKRSTIDFAPDVKVSAQDGKSAVEVAVTQPVGSGSLVLHNPRAQALWTQEQGPANPFQRVSG